MSPPRMPAVFFGHGSPMNALEQNRYTEAWRRIGEMLPRPRAVLAVSAHYMTHGTHATALAAPPTIHDFGGFPRALHELTYPAPGDPDLAEELRELLAPTQVGLDQNWGLDHGSWSVLLHVYPDADVPVVQLSLDEDLSPRGHYDLAQRLRPLRDRGVLIAGFGNVVHNLAAVQWGSDTAAHDWAKQFNQAVLARIAAGDHAALIDYGSLGPEARLAVPTAEHYLPLLYVLAQQEDGETAVPVVDGIEMGAIGMLSLSVGAAA